MVLLRIHVFVIKINWDPKRCKHAIERMWLRGISVDDVQQGILKGRKVKQKSGLLEAFYRYYSIVYEEKIFARLRKIYPITVKLW